jgi:hypothetical protein
VAGEVDVRAPTAPAAAAPRSKPTEAPARAYGRLPLYFERNTGQGESGFDFLARGAGYAVGVSATEAAWALSPPSAAARQLGVPWQAAAGTPLAPDGRPLGSPAREAAAPPTIIRMRLEGADPHARGAGVDPLVTRVNYFLGDDPAHWHSDIPTYGRVEYPNIYAGIDLAYYAAPHAPFGRGAGGEGGLEYDFTARPGADPSAIRLEFAGADSVSLDADGDLVLHTARGDVVQHAPVLYQDVGGARTRVAGAFRLDGPGGGCPGAPAASCPLPTASFWVGPYDRTRPLVIDPQVLAYSTYLGGPNYDYGNAVAVDAFGSAYVAGEAGHDFPLVNPIQSYGGGLDAFVAKLSPDGSALLYSTYLGGSYEDAAFGVAVDGKGAAYVTGVSESSDFPSTPGAFQTSGPCDDQPTCSDAFVAKLSPAGSALLFATFLGGSGSESGDGIAVDQAGSAYVMGMTNSSNFPTRNAVQPSYGGGTCSYPTYHYCFDAFVTKLNATGSALAYSTYLGGSDDEAYYFGQTGGIALDPSGYAYVTGYTFSAYDFPTYHALQPTWGGGLVDAYVTKLSPSGTAFVYSTYLGGKTGDFGKSIAADGAGDAYVTGTTNSTDFPTTPGCFQSTNKGENDVFLSKIRTDGSALVYSSYLGGSDHDSATSIAVDKAGNAHVTGFTYSSADFPTKNAFQPVFGGGYEDAFVTELSPAGSGLVYSSYLGGGGYQDAGDDAGLGVALDAQGNAYVAGVTRSASFPTVKPLQAQNAGYTDAFVSKVSRLARAPVSGHQSGP